MREKIERFARGEFDDRSPMIVLPEEPLRWEQEPEQQFTGYLRFRSENGICVRGYVLSSDGNLKIAVPQFYGKNLKLEFTYSSKHTSDGDKRYGKIFLITNAGEFQVPFEVSIRKKTAREGENSDD